MKLRTTFLVSSPSATHPDNFNITPNSLTLKSLPASREDRFSILQQELPRDVSDLLKRSSQVRLRWDSGNGWRSGDPYAARVPAGLHVLLPENGDLKEEDEGVCQLLKMGFDIDECVFVTISKELQQQKQLQLYHPSSSLETLHSYLLREICKGQSEKCRDTVARLVDADYLDIDWEADLGKLVVKAFWGMRDGEVWAETIQGNGDVEIGVFGQDKAVEDEEVQLAGFVVTVGESETLEPTLFSFPSRHRASPNQYTLSTRLPTGLHPTLSLSIPAPLQPPSEDCNLNAYFTLPRSVFVDKYQLSSTSTQLLSSLGIAKLYPITGETDLEAPVWAVKGWGSSVLVEIDTTSSTTTTTSEEGGRGEVVMNLPLHLRYLQPSTTSTKKEKITIPWPSLFWSCPTGATTTKWHTNPFDKTNLGWEHHFPEYQQTTFHHLFPATADTWTRVDIPVLGLESAGVVKVGTAVVVVVGLGWVVGKVVRKLWGGEAKGKGKKE